jgi:peptidyl-prolyl cis-trans isomerase SurA
MTRFSTFALALSATVVAATAGAQNPTVPLPAAPQPTHPVMLDRVAAIVGDQVITRYDLLERINQRRQQGVQAPTDSAARLKFELDLLNEMVDEELLLQKAKDLKIEVADNDLNNTVDRQVKETRARFANDAEYRTQLTLAGMGTPEEYRKMLIEQLRRAQTIDRLMGQLRQDNKLIAANVSDADVEEAFNRAKGQLGRRPASVTFRQVVIAPKATAAAKAIAKAKAESLLAEIKRGGDFELLAKRETMDPATKETGGDLGWARRGKYVPEFDQWVWALRPGNMSPVVETSLGYHIIRVDRVSAGEVKARHILIRPKLDSADVVRARAEADTVATQWRAGVPFDTLSKKHHDFAAREETSLLTPYPRDSLPVSYQQAFAGKKGNDIVIFDIPDPQREVPKIVVAQLLTVDEGGEHTLQEMKEIVRSRLAYEGGVRRYLDGLRKRAYVSVRLDQPIPTTPAATSSSSPPPSR